MAHKSKKKHLKHVHQHEPETAAPRPTKHAGAKAEIEVGRAGKRQGKTNKAKAADKAKAAKPAKKRGIVRSLAKAAGEKLAARPKRVLKRVKAMLG